MIDEQSKLLVLAHLKNGKTPGEISEFMDVSYGKALKLKKELHHAEEAGNILALFNLPQAALDILLDSVKKELTPAIEAFGLGELVDDEVHNLADRIEGAGMLDKELQTAATALVSKIAQVALTVNNAETVLSLSKSLCELQVAFFGSGVHGNNASNGPALPSPGSFEKHLRS